VRGLHSHQRFGTPGKKETDGEENFHFVAITCPRPDTVYHGGLSLTLPTLPSSPDKETETQKRKVIGPMSNHKGVSNGSQIQGHNCLAAAQR
jgi:hypothetical protein